MVIPFYNYIDINSSVQGQSQVSTRNYGALVISINPLIPTQSGPLVFTSALAVGQYFGTSSGEYARAVFYFGWESKQGNQCSQLSFYFWNNDTATGSLIYGVPATYALSTFTAITSGELELTLGGFTHTLTGINLSGAGSLTAVATDITTAINAYSAGGAAWTGAVVTYNASAGQFNLASGATGLDTVSVTAAPSNDLAAPLGWLTGAIYSNGTAAQTLTANLSQLINITNNFGSFCFGPSSINTEANVLAAAEWNNSLTPNIQFMFSVNVSPANASTWQAALANINGVALTLSSPVSSEYPEMAPMMILGATNYDLPGASQNYEFQQFNLTPSVTSQSAYNTYTALNINFYGSTQTAGQIISFYQQGFMQGLVSQPVSMTDYANELWFKDALGAALANLLLTATQVPANNAGKALILSNMQPVINQAVENGTIETGSQLTSQQIAVINTLSGTQNAWLQVQTTGYWYGVVFESYVQGSATLYKAVYTLIYKQENDINMIQGNDILI